MGIFTDSEGNIRWISILIIPVVLIIGLIIIFNSFTTIDAGHRGVVLRFGEPLPYILTEGFHTITPIADNVVKVDVRTQKYTATASSATKDLLDVLTDVTVNYHLVPENVNTLYKSIGLSYEDKVIQPAVQEVVKAVTAKYDASQLITERESVKQDIETSLRDRLIKYDIILETLSITNFKFPDQFNQAITDKQTAVQLALKAENDLKRIQVEAEQVVAKAQGEAQATLTVAQAQAQAVKLLQEQLRVSPEYVKYQAIQKWNGAMPQFVGGTMPLISIPMSESSS